MSGPESGNLNSPPERELTDSEAEAKARQILDGLEQFDRNQPPGVRTVNKPSEKIRIDALKRNNVAEEPEIKRRLQKIVIPSDFTTLPRDKLLDIVEPAERFVGPRRPRQP